MAGLISTFHSTLLLVTGPLLVPQSGRSSRARTAIAVLLRSIHEAQACYYKLFSRYGSLGLKELASSGLLS